MLREMVGKTVFQGVLDNNLALGQSRTILSISAESPTPKAKTPQSFYLHTHLSSTFEKPHDTTAPRAPASATSSWIKALVAEQVYQYFRVSLGSNTVEISTRGSPDSPLPPFRLLKFLPHAFRSRGSTGPHQCRVHNQDAAHPENTHHSNHLNKR